ncbi:MAG: response regulator [Candidatus Omnitrophica bacterium]|nr:response regulator [Candidatus Omnitrophota bacterium]
MLAERIVVIDDDQRVHKSIEMSFNEYEIVSFYEGKSALEYLSKPNEINLILLDVMMPGMDGISVLKEIKAKNEQASVIIMTAYGSKEVIVQALRGHADDFIEKPFKMEDLRMKIHNILKNKINYNIFRSNKPLQVERIKRFVARNYHNVSLQYIADELCLSPKYVSRLFSSNSEAGFRDFKVGIKIEKAKELLENSSMSVTDISIKLGYQNPESFMRIFKRAENITPLQYRRRFINSKTMKS